MIKPAIALVALTPLVTWVVPTVAAHPELAPLVPLSFERIGALLYIALVVWVAAIEIAGRYPLSLAYRAGTVFAVAAILASLLGFDPLAGIAASLVFMGVVLSGSGVYRAAREGAWAQLLAAWLWSGVILCAIALAAMLARWPASAYAFAHGRAVGIFENPNELALYALAICGPAAGAILYGYPARRLAFAALAAAIAALIATGSRSGEAAFAIGAVALAFVLLPRRTSVYVGLAVVAAIAIGFAIGLDWRHNPAENDTRIAAWQAGLRTVAFFPLTGVGVGSYYRVYPVVRPPDAPGPHDPIAFDPHNFYLSVAAETGLVGLSAFVATIVVFVRELRGVLAKHAEPGRRFGVAVLAGLLAIACHLIFNGFAIAIPLWTVLAAFALGVPPGEHERAA